MRPVPAILAALALGACAGVDQLASPESDVPVAFASAHASANSSVDLSLVTWVGCANGGAGEFIELTGSLHLMVHASTNGAGHTTLISHANPQNVVGVGLLSGNGYRGNGVTRSVQTLEDGVPRTTAFVNNFLLIGQGRAPSLRAHVVLNVAIDGQGRIHVAGGDPHVTCE